MELKATLNKPYTAKEREMFIIEQNRKNGYKIKYTENSIEAWELTEQEKEEKRQQQFAKDFFNTSLGYVRRNVTMKDTSTKSFLTDILPLLEVDVPIITYNIDGTQNLNVAVTEQFITECKQQVLKDFYGEE